MSQSIRPDRGIRWGFATIAAVVAVALGGGTALATTTSAGVSETFTIAASVTVQNVPSTGTFASPPACTAPCLTSDYSYLFNATVGTNNGTGLTVSVKATSLVAGANSIPVSLRGISFGNASGFTRTAAPGLNIGSLDPNTAFQLGNTSANGTWTIAMEPILRADPNNYPAGAYAGTFTVVATTNP